jgi:uncharacterized protein (DUF111 family)
MELVQGGRVRVGRVLDIGCGTGTNVLYLAEKGFDVSGVDISKVAIRRAAAKAGKRDLKTTPNLIRIVIGHEPTDGSGSDVVQVLETNLDDVSGEVMGHAIQRVLDSGARDAWVSSAQFKKSRPGYTLHAICTIEDLEKISEIIMKETGTLGVRYMRWNRFVLSREIIVVKVSLGQRTFDARVKIARNRSGTILRIKPEFEDADAIAQATSRSVREISGLILEIARKSLG